MSENERNEQEGLFSDAAETPKRENPYLKKNREKTKKEKSKPEKPRVQEIPSSADGAEEGYVRKRTFSDWIFEHVKLIASIATILVILALVLITDVVDVVEDLITQSQQADKQEITLTYVKGLSEKSSPITWADLDSFRRDETKADGSVTWMIEVKGTSYEVWISGTSTAGYPTYVYLCDMNTGDRMILGEDNFDAFVENHSKG